MINIGNKFTDQGENNETVQPEQVGNTEEEKDAKQAAKNVSDVAKDQAKEKGKQLAEKAAKDPSFMAKIIKILPILIKIAIVVIIIFVIVGVIAFFSMMPGILAGKFQQFCRSAWADFTGFFTGDSITNRISDDNVKDLAQYIQNMGYDIEGYGFGDVVYEENSNEDTMQAGKYPKIKKILGVNDSGWPLDRQNDYLQSYLAANQATYMEAHYSVRGAFCAFGSTIANIFTKTDWSSANLSNMDPKTWSTGLLNIEAEDNTPLFNIGGSAHVRVKPKEEKLLIYEKNISFFGWDIHWGQTFSIDLSNWTAKYGRPTELFLALHLSTMMPDLTHSIATQQEFNTKVNIELQKVNIKYNMNLTNSAGQSVFLEKNEDGTMSDAMRQFIDVYTRYCIKSVKYLDPEGYEGNGTTRAISTTTIGPEYDAGNTTTQMTAEELYNEAIADEAGKEEMFEKITENAKNSIIVIITVRGQTLLLELNNSNDNVPATVGGLTFTYAQMQELAGMIHSGEKGASIYWPYIKSVTNHWYYDDISFMHGQTYGAYRKAKTATKTMLYEPEDNSSLSNYSVELKATLTSDQGIYYQVCEPEMTGPNNNIKKLFSNKYYRYDGTSETARKIAIAKALDDTYKTYKSNGNDINESNLENMHTTVGTADTYVFHGDNTLIISQDEKDEYIGAKKAELGKDGYDDYKDSPMYKKNVTFSANASDTLSAFSILERIKNEASEESLRNLKQLVVDLGYYTEDQMNQNETQLLLWPLDNGLPGDNTTWEKGKDVNEFGLEVSNLSATTTVVAPGDADIIFSDTNSITMKLRTLNDSTMEILNYKYKGYFKKLNKDEFVDMTIKIQGFTPTVTKGTTVTRGQKIGNLGNNAKIIIKLYKADKTIIDNIESYMTSSYTITDENLIWQTKNLKTIKGNQYKDTTVALNQSTNVQASDVKITANIQEVFDYLTEHGLTKAGACGVLGIIKNESGFNVNAVNSSDGGYGLLQWTHGRRTSLENWCNSNNYDYQTVEGQLEYFIYELKASYSSQNGYGYPVYETLTTSNSVEDATYMFFAHDEAGTNYTRESGYWNEPYYDGGPLVSSLYAQRLADAKGYYAQLAE